MLNDRCAFIETDSAGNHPAPVRTKLLSQWAALYSLYPREKLAEDVTIPPEGSGFAGITLAYNTKSQDAVDQVLQTVAGLDTKIIKKAEIVFEADVPEAIVSR